ncbi:hypothetical protein CONCODRAFT_76956 [Conidiobolus coronatus NRRL 28638]|uniref:Inhibitor I9 domain-containing protein n=1 Tax=Conidiobolus coronatus (strain ATCC 28846 / CBS 209.66 / NRRL 28638) TaxID=796925 RepID=A0A137PGS7_CONC2|nr:hypothetical protein CONCODRAFT_76956 [Conidiobolus coronatus NRRL 28638]|eukprot:KXN74204.1 hypothetical protein CONCODRAFT_76956 [Conidiobolus coronatus NRRL 28638]
MSSPTNSFSKYVVNFEDDTPSEIIDTQIDLIQSRGGTIYEMNDRNSYKGFNAYFPDDFVEILETHPKILMIEKS